ncbi:MAG TPA: ATP synthase F0 subunit B, partial [Terriglobia bacterium]|nr:ATP synthase F0 subunit B [Terriglobia bacterium]
SFRLCDNFRVLFFGGMFPALQPSCEFSRTRNLTAMAAMSLDLSVILIVLMVWALYFVLKKSFFDPINQILTTREAASQGALEEARAQLAVVEKKSSAYAEALKEARLESYRQQETFRAEAVQQRSQIVAQGRQGSEQLIGSARSEIQSQVASAKKSLESEVAGIADGIVKGILR